MKTQAIEALIEHCKHVGIMERITMQPLIVAAEAELKAISSPPPLGTDDLEKRVLQFSALKLPGQPMSMHMGTSYLVDDLWKEIKRLRKES